MDEVVLKVDQQDLQVLNAALGELPVKVALGLIQKINVQIREQLTQQEEKEKDKTSQPDLKVV